MCWKLESYILLLSQIIIWFIPIKITCSKKTILVNVFFTNVLDNMRNILNHKELQPFCNPIRYECVIAWNVILTKRASDCVLFFITDFYN